jgi:hypothetical protein
MSAIVDQESQGLAILSASGSSPGNLTELPKHGFIYQVVLREAQSSR